MYMKKLLLLLLLVFCGLIQYSTAQVPSYVPTNGLVGWWPFTGNAIDSSGNGNHGTVVSGLLSNDRKGNANSSYYLNGQTDYITIPASSSMLPKQISLSVWIKVPSNYSANNAIGMVIRSRLFGYIIFFDSTSHNLNLNIFTEANDIPSKCFTTGIKYNDNSWHHIVGTFDGQSIKLYIDGLLISSTITPSTSIYYQSDGKIAFGRDGNNSSPLTALYQGWIDDIGIWNRALTHEEINGLYKSCTIGLSINPVTANVITNSNVSFNATTLLPPSSFQWQTNPLNVGWQNVPNNLTYSGATTNSLKVNNVKVANHLQQFRVIASGASCIDTSAVATISIKDTCIVTNLTSVTDTLKINAILSGLSAPNNVNLIKIFPNPARDHITIDFGKFTLMSGYKIRITNAAGLIVYTSSISQQTSYIDLSSWSGKGIYYVQIIDKQNITIENKKIIIQ